MKKTIRTFRLLIATIVIAAAIFFGFANGNHLMARENYKLSDFESDQAFYHATGYKAIKQQKGEEYAVNNLITHWNDGDTSIQSTVQVLYRYQFISNEFVPTLEAAGIVVRPGESVARGASEPEATPEEVIETSEYMVSGNIQEHETDKALDHAEVSVSVSTEERTTTSA